MSRLRDLHIARVRAVNGAPTTEEHRIAEVKLSAWRDGVAAALHWNDQNRGAFLLEADCYYIDRGCERPMCGGVFLDWMPTALTDVEAREVEP